MKSMRLIGLCALIGLTGCFSLNRGGPTQRQFVLGGGPAPEKDVPPRKLAGVAVGVRRLQLAPYLESTSIVVRRGPQEILYSEFDRWGELPAEGINRAVVSYLVAGAPFRVVDVAPWPTREKYDYLIQLHLLRFEGQAPVEPTALEGEVHLLATWEILRQRDGEVLARGTTDYRKNGWQVGDYAGLVTQLDAGLRVLAADLMTSLEKLRS